MRTVSLGLAIALGALGLLLSAGAQRAHACGGLFCNSASPVNQAAERILFSENGDGTVTAVIEIQYQGPAERFSWVLPVPGEPVIEISSTAAFDRLQTATNPQYMLQTTFEDDCPVPASGSAGGRGATVDGGGANESPDVVVLAAGTVGPFDYELIMVNPQVDDPADAAITWLTENEYDVTTLGPEVLGPYLADGLNLLAFRLNKQNDTGSIRPIVITYESERPFIPIRPTAVAANDDMGVMVWVVGASRAVPENYKALELNEALINWFNPMDTYDAVVSAAADEAGGQGFVTELADDSSTLTGVILADWEEQEWDRISSQQYARPLDFVLEAAMMYGEWDGFEDALRAALTLPDGVTVADILRCANCYATNPGVMLDEGMFRLRLYEDVYRPMLETQERLLSRPYVTRLYTTMSAEDMTMDPSFTFNGDLDDVSNLHMATQILECNGDGGFRIVLPQGDTVTGSEQGVWPNEVGGDQPAARKIMQLSRSGQGEVLEDNSDRIAGLLGGARPGTGRRDAGADADGGELGGGGDDDGCAAAPFGARTRAASGNALLALLALGWLRVRARRR
jgi:hypothetical protein